MKATKRFTATIAFDPTRNAEKTAQVIKWVSPFFTETADSDPDYEREFQFSIKSDSPQYEYCKAYALYIAQSVSDFCEYAFIDARESFNWERFTNN